MAEQGNWISNDGVSRRSFLGKTSAALVAAAGLQFWLRRSRLRT